MTSKISCVYAREILDSRGNPTVEVDVLLENGILGRAAVPSGASTGRYEALELRDQDATRFGGKGVLKVVESINRDLAAYVLGKNALDQVGIDRALLQADGTPNKSRFGANALVGISMSVARAAANYLAIPLYRYLGGINARTLPLPFMNILNGGAHADNNIDVQEYMIVPVGASNFAEALRMGAETFQALKRVMREQKHHTAVGDEGGFAPSLKSNEEAFEIIISAIQKANYKPGQDIALAIDVAASELYEDNKYIFKKSDQSRRTSSEMIKLYTQWVNDYPIISIEDGLAQDDWKGWADLTSVLGERIQIVGDDIFVTNTERLTRGINEGVANSILIKVNQIGTLTETFEAISLAHRSGYTTMISHRSGETEDTFISDLAVAAKSRLIKTGSVSRTDRVAKYNQLLRIAESLGDEAIFPVRDDPLLPWVQI